MAYVEVWKSGRFVTRRRVDEQKAKTGCRIRLGATGEVRVAIGQSEKLGEFEVRMFAGRPPVTRQQYRETASTLPATDQSLPPLSVVTTSPGTGQMDECSDVEGYKMIERLGGGGMGTVWRAEQLSTRREVALKLMVSHRLDSTKAQARFEREVELTARLDHPNIARIYDSGLHRGMYYYAMELIDGEPLDRYVGAKALSQNQILVLMRTVCQAIHYAHLHGVIHRDLKPSNIIVGRDGQPHVVDFGLARTFLQEDEALTISVEGEIAGTPAYMSPEQAAGHHKQIDTRTDVFSLGVILYQLLTGQSPHDLTGSLFDILERIVQGKIKPPHEINKSIDDELGALLLKSLALDPDDRYDSVGDLQDDIDNYLHNEPLRAQAPTILYLLGKKARKYRLQVAVGLAVSLVILVTIVVAYTKVVAERAVQESQARELDLKSAKLTWAELQAKALGNDREEARAALRIISDEYVSAQDQISQLNHKLGQIKPPVAVRRIDLRPGAALASSALVRKPCLPGGIESWTLETYGHRSPIAKLTYSADGSQLASAGHDGTVRVWDAKSGQLVKILVDCNGVDLPSFADKHDAGRFSWSANNDRPTRVIDEIITLWQLELPKAWRPLKKTTTALALSGDRSMLALGDRDGTIRVINPKSGQMLHISGPAWCGPINSVCFSSDGKILATCAGAGTVCLWDAHRWQPVSKFEADWSTDSTLAAINTIAWGPPDTVIAKTDNHQGVVEILDSQSGQVLRVLYGDGFKIASVSWSPDGALLAAGMINGKVNLWNVESDSNEPLIRLDAHSGSVNTLAWIPGSQSLVTAGKDGKIKLWEPRARKLTRSLDRHTGPITCLELSPNGNFLASGSLDGTIRLWDVKGGRTFNLLKNEPNDTEDRQSVFTAVAWSPDNVLLASGDSTGNIRVWDPNSRQPKRSFKANCGSVSSLAWSPDGRVIVCAGADGTARVWDTRNDFQQHVTLLPLWGSLGPGIAVSPAGDYRGPAEIADHLVYIVMTERGQETLTAADFKSRYGWINEPWQVGLYAPGLEKVDRIHVRVDAKPPYDGKTWATAFCDLQDALSVAQPNTEIWVAAGIYRPDRGTGARTASFHLKNGVRLLGGFSGKETRVSQRDPNKYETILSGDLKGNDGPNFTNYDENSYHVVTSIQTDPDAVLDGLNICGGNANGPEEGEYHMGGGMYNTSRPTIINCVFRYNSARDFGGGMVNSNVDDCTLTSCKFIGNRVIGGGKEGRSNGGGLYNLDSNLFVTDCTFIGNFAAGIGPGGIDGGGDGGGMWHGGGRVKVNKCSFIKNVANGMGGGIDLYATRSTIVKECTFIGNSAEGYGGGGICCARTPLEMSPIFTNCVFISNRASQGGGMMAWGGIRQTLTNCMFLGNNARQVGGGIRNIYGCNVVLSNCLFSGNSAVRGGAIETGGGAQKYDLELTNCTFTKNVAIEMVGAIDQGESICLTKVTNCILWDNSDPKGDNETAQIQGGKAIINNSCIQKWTGKFRGIGNFALDPLFVDPNGPDNRIGTLDDNLRLSLGSPCRNAGDNSALPADVADLDNDNDVNEPIPFDIEGKPRILNNIVDLGAYESG